VAVGTRRCRGCGVPLAVLARRNRAYCCAACRVRALRARRRLAELEPGVEHAFPVVLEAAIAEQRLVGTIALAARGDWRASAWLLERQYPERWAARERGSRRAWRDADELAERRRR
jgi:hypothetical protein